MAGVGNFVKPIHSHEVLAVGMSQMPKDVEKRIRALPGNNVCCDCDNLNPQWASVSYGSLMCLECSGHHRSLGVHLSFVRSVAMDSWTEKQIAAMEKAGGNDKLIEFFKSKGIAKSMKISTKYNTKQAQYYRDRLARWLEGRTEPPPDPGRYDPVTGVSEAQGAEPLPGETTDQYNARQAKLREEARERMRAKFGDRGFGGCGSNGSVSYDGSGDGAGEGGLGDKLGSAMSGLSSFFKSNVLENEKVRGAVGGAVSGVGQVAGGIFRGEDKSSARLDTGKSIAQQEREFWDSMYVKPGTENSAPVSAVSAPAVSAKCNTSTSAIGPARAKSFNAGASARAIKADDDWGDFDDFDAMSSAPAVPKAKPAPAVEPPVQRQGEPKPADEIKGAPLNNARAASGVDGPPAKPAPAVKPTTTEAPVTPTPLKPTKTEAPMTPTPPKKSGLKSSDDFFADFGM